jgi:tetratricopeptide (TPR) repeat protein
MACRFSRLFSFALILFSCLICRASGDPPPSSVYAHFLYGSWLYENRDFEKAVEYYRKALELKPQNDYIVLKLAQSLIHQRKSQAAFDLLLPLSEQQSPYSGEADILLASICLLQKKEMTAVSFLNHALSLNPSDKNIYIALSRLYEELGLKTEAIQTNRKAQERYPFELHFKTRLGVLYFLESRFEESLAAYEQAYALDSRDLKVLLGLALCHDRLGNPEKAVRFFESALEIDPLNRTIYEEIIRLKSGLEDWPGAFATCEQLVSMTPDSPGGYLRYAMLCLRSGQIEKGIKYLEKHRERFPRNADVPFWLARLYEKKSDPESAEANYQKCISIAPDRFDCRYRYALLLHARGARKESIRQLKEALALNGEHAPSLNLLGYLLLETDAPINEALSYIERALKLEPENPAYLDSMGWALYKKGQLEEALLYLEKAFAKSQEKVIEKHLLRVRRAIAEKESPPEGRPEKDPRQENLNS